MKKNIKNINMELLYYFLKEIYKSSKYSPYKCLSFEDEFIVKLEMQEHCINVEVLQRILKDLNVICIESGKLLCIPSKKIHFKLKKVQPGCIVLIFTLKVVGPLILSYLIKHFIKGFIGDSNIENINMFIENYGKLLREAFIYFLTTKDRKGIPKNLKMAKARLFRELDKIPNLNAITISTNEKSIRITKENFIDYYA